jgi:hypothetical protein
MPRIETTNHVPRDLIDASQLTDAERDQFDYLNWRAIDDGRDSATFFRYRGDLYDLGTFTRTGDPYWHGACPDSMSTATVVHLTDDGERVIVGYQCY